MRSSTVASPSNTKKTKQVVNAVKIVGVLSYVPTVHAVSLNVLIYSTQSNSLCIVIHIG